MKKIKRLFAVLIGIMVCALSCFCLFGCNGDNGDTTPPPSDIGGDSGDTGDSDDEQQPQLNQFIGIAFADRTLTYDGDTYTITVSGSLPEGTNVVYENNSAANAGIYNATATLTKEGYETTTLTATLTINKATFGGIDFADKTSIWTGREHRIEVEYDGDLPQGTEITYSNNAATAAGTYDATATVTNPNYETLVLRATLTIKNLTNAAKGIVDTLLEKPDPWSFLPEAFTEENMAYSSSPVRNFADGFVNVSDIARKPIGKQMNVLYDGLIDTAKLLGYVDNVYAVGNTIASVYQEYINKNPDDYAAFTGAAGGFKIKITLDGRKSEILAGNSSVSVELAYDADSDVRKGRIQITSGAALKYEASDDSFKIAVRIGAVGVANIKQIEFARDGSGNVAGYMREFTGTENNNLKTTAAIMSNSVHTVIVSDKRESDDLIINGYEEVYDSRTGEFLGGEVAETVKVKDYDTLWFNLYDVLGFTTVKAVKKSGIPKPGENADDVYINGQTSVFQTKKNLGLGSRHFDVEMKDVWYIVKTYNAEKDKYEYEKVKTSVPMLFVQKENIGEFTDEVKTANKNAFGSDPILPSATPMTSYFETMQGLFIAAKEQVLRDDIERYIGSAHSFFSAQ